MLTTKVTEGGRPRPIRVRVGDRVVYVHRLIWEAVYGPIPAGMDIHHINGDNRDNRIDNLRLVTPKEHRRVHTKREIINRDGVSSTLCRLCGQTKPVTEFYRYSYLPGGRLSNHCKDCTRQASRECQRKLRDERRALAAADQTTSTPGGA